MSSEPKIIWSATPTPFLDDGRLDLDSLERVIEQHRRLGVTGLFMAGTCGEGPFMPTDQRAELVRMTKRFAAAQIHVAVQVSDTSAVRVRENIVHMQAAGADSVVIAAPWISWCCNAGFARRYFFEPIEAAEVPVGIYVLKQPANSALNPALWGEIIAHPKISYVKDSTSSAEYTRLLVAEKAKRPGLVLKTGDEFDVLTPVSAGYDGALLGTGILTANMVRHALDALSAGDRVTAEAWQRRSNEFLWDLFCRDLSIWLGGLKYALVRLGIFRSEFMHFNYPLTAPDRRRIDTALERERDVICPGGGV